MSSQQRTDLVEEVVNQLVRDTTNQYSSLRYHSLLRDLYGDDGIQIGPGSPQGLVFLDRSNDFINAAGVSITSPTLDQEMLNNTGNQFFWLAVNDPNGSGRTQPTRGLLQRPCFHLDGRTCRGAIGKGAALSIR